MSSNPSLAANQLEYFGHITVTCLDLGSLGVSAHLRGLPRGLNEVTDVWVFYDESTEDNPCESF